MNDTTTASSDVALLNEETAIAIFDDKAKFEQLFSRIKEEAEKCDTDMDDPKARKELASMAYKVARTKTAIDEQGKKLTEGMRSQIKAIDAMRKACRDRLDALKDKIRAPLTAWEEREKQREAEAAAEVERLRNSAIVNIETSLTEVRQRLVGLRELTIKSDLHGDATAYVDGIRLQAIGSLETVLERMEKEEADRIELERLRKEAEEAARKAEKERAAREAEEAARREAELAEQRRLAEAKEREEAAQRAKEREEALAKQAAQEAEEKARREAEEKAAQQRAEQEQEIEKERAAQQKALEDERRAREAAEERERAREAAEAEAERKRKEREADQEHRSKIMRASKEAIMEHADVDEETAKRVVLAICSGNIPHTKIVF